MMMNKYDKAVLIFGIILLVAVIIFWTSVWKEADGQLAPAAPPGAATAAGGAELSSPLVQTRVGDGEVTQYFQNLSIPDRASGFVDLVGTCPEPSARPIGATFDLINDTTTGDAETTRVVVHEGALNTTDDTQWFVVLESLPELDKTIENANATVSLICLGPEEELETVSSVSSS
jgi:hypothetical protein